MRGLPVQMAFLTIVLVATPSALHAADAAPACTPARIPQAWASSGTTYADTDSLAACTTPDGKTMLFATSKQGHCIDIFDGETGRFVRRHGRQGAGEGDFNRPNGIAVVEFPVAGATTAPAWSPTRPVVFVVERDNARVQAFWPGDLKPAGLFGKEQLKKPYGLAVSYHPDGILLYVTDNDVPSEHAVKVYRVRLHERNVKAEYVRNLGDATGIGALGKTETVAVDDRLDRVLLCDEAPDQLCVKVYTRNGRFTGRTFGRGLIRGQPEGMAVYDAPGEGVVILTDQQPDITIWHVFDRNDYRHLGAFTGEPTIANTDGVCLYARPFGRFSSGAFFAVHDDSDIRAYDYADVLRGIRKTR